MAVFIYCFVCWTVFVLAIKLNYLITKIDFNILNELSKIIHQNNVEKGFYEDDKNIGEMLALIHSEVSEALECDRKDRYCQISAKSINLSTEDLVFKADFRDCVKDTFEDELADILIRVLDLAAFKKIDIESHVKAKVRYNKLRPYKHGKKY